MILKIEKGVIYAYEEGFEKIAIGSMFDNSMHEHEKLIECGTELIESVKEFVSDVKTGSLKPKTAVNKFELTLEKYGLAS